MTTPANTPRTVVVGVDGSDGARLALDWALADTGPGDRLVLVHAWMIQPVASFEAPFYNPADFDVAAGRFLDRFIEEADLPTDGPTIESVVRHGSAAHVIVTEAEDADLVVVGSRGLGGLKGALLGSVSTQVVHHAPCPVVVVPTDRR